MAGVAIQNNYPTNPLDYLNSISGLGDMNSTGGAGASSGASGLSDNSATGGMSEQQMLQLIQELLALIQQAMQNSSGDDSDGSSTPSVGSGGGGAAPSMDGGGAAPAAPAATTPAAPAATTPAATTPAATTPAAPAATTPAAPAASSTGSGSSSTGLDSTPQTVANTPAQSQQVASQYVTNLMQDFNLTQPQAQGIVANLWHESGGMNSGINQGGAIGAPTNDMADDNANGYGIAQWGGSRKQGLLDYAQSNGLDPSSQAANYGYLKQELQTTQSGAITAVKDTNTAQAATEAFCNTFEKPSDPEMNSRLADLALVQSA